ncbi:hypothetical protein B566_EDAN004503 [Ephemera danica]|nr:hypothetical protein B566_EDAN004503 [Ephemera danica]
MFQKPPSTVQFFCRGDYYTLHGPDAVFAAKEVFKSTSVLKFMTSDSSRRQLEYVVLSKLNFEAFVRDLLLVKNYRVEVFVCPPGSSRQGTDWVVEYKASPGNLAQFEDVLFGEGSMAQRGGVPLAGVAAMVGVGFIEGTQRRMLVSQFPDSDSLANLEAVILQLGPRELLIPAAGDKAENNPVKEVAERCGLLVTERKRVDFNSDEGFLQDLRRLLHFKEGQSDNLVNDSTNFGQFTLSQYDSEQYVRVDGTTVKAVNLRPGPCTSGIGRPCESLLGLLGQHGIRLLSRWLQQPLRDVARLEERQDVVEALKGDNVAMEALSKDYMRGVPDLQSLARKLQRKKATLQDLFKIYQGVNRLGGVITTLEGLGATGQALASLKALLLDPLSEYRTDMEGYLKMIESTIDMEEAAEGNYRVTPNFDDDLKELNERLEELKEEMQRSLQRVARDLHLEAGKTLKLENNPQWGYFFRVTLKEEKVLRDRPEYQTLDTNKAGVRFLDNKLRTQNEQYVGTCTEYEEQQKTLVTEIVNIAAGYAEVLCKLSDVLAQIDVLNSFALTAASAPDLYVRPKLLPPGSGVLKFTELRHPCLEMIDGIEFVPNNADFSEDKCRMMILTGPNMGGKSTYIRSIGAAAIMAQVGCFVPAQEAELSLVDAVLARIGAGDSQARGVSTFMAEMLETSAILRKVRGFCLFATHFHELTALAQVTPGVLNFHVTAETSGGHLILLYRVRPGPCDQSFGLHVAKMANFPDSVLESAEKQQRELELQHKWVPAEFRTDEDNLRKEGEVLVDKFLQDVAKLVETSMSDEDLCSSLEALKSKLLAANNPHVQELLDRGSCPAPMDCS